MPTAAATSPPFDERQYGLSSTYDLVRQAQKDGLLRVERNRQGILRIFPAERFPKAAPEQPAEEQAPAETANAEFEVPFPEPEPPLPESELPMTLAEIPPEEGEAAPGPEAASVMGSEAGQETTAPKPKAKRTRKTASAASTKTAKGQRRKTKSPREKTKDEGQSKAGE